MAVRGFPYPTSACTTTPPARVIASRYRHAGSTTSCEGVHEMTTTTQAHPSELPILPRARYPFDRAFYERLVRDRESFQVADSVTLDAHRARLRRHRRAGVPANAARGTADPRCLHRRGRGSHRAFLHRRPDGNRRWAHQQIHSAVGDPTAEPTFGDLYRGQPHLYPKPPADPYHFSYGAHCNAHLWHLYTGHPPLSL